MLVGLWKSGIPSFCPSGGQWNVWMQLHDPKTLVTAVLKTTKKYKHLSGNMDSDYLVKYCSSVANAIKRDVQKGGAA